jgi:molybdopterin-guanine dinucleotide biosynthesis protein B
MNLHLNDGKMPFVIAITGKSDAGKTSLIKGLIPEMKRRGYKVAVVKNCPHGFDLDIAGKDSWHFAKAGAEGILLQSPLELGLIRTKNNTVGNLNELAKYYLADFDLVLAEGFAQDTSTRKIEVLRKGISEELEAPLESLVAIVTDFAFSTDKPTFNHTQLFELADFVEKFIEENGGEER